MTVKQEPLVLTLADGNDYSFPPLDMNAMEEVENKFDKSWGEIWGVKNIRISHIKFTLWCVLKCQYPEMTEAEAGKLLTANVFNSSYAKIVKHIAS